MANTTYTGIPSEGMIDAVGGRMNSKEMAQELARLQAENAVLKAKGQRGPATVSVKGRFLGEKYSDGKGGTVDGKGNVSVYGLGRFPVTLYPSQWARLLDKADDIRGFIATNEGKLAAGKDDVVVG